MKQRFNYGKRVVYDCIDFMEEAMEDHKYGSETKAVEKCAQKYSISVTNIWRWWRYYKANGEIKIIIDEKMRALRKRYKWTSSICEEYVQEIKRIVDNNPEYYLDEIAEEFARITGVVYYISTFWRILKTRIDCSLQVCYDRVQQRNED